MTNEEQVSQVREKIAEYLIDFAMLSNTERLTSISEYTDQILAIPELKILAPDQKLPGTGCEIMDGDCVGDGYCFTGCRFPYSRERKLSQQDMLKDKWVKVV
jgi:hypothetical protein